VLSTTSCLFVLRGANSRHDGGEDLATTRQNVGGGNVEAALVRCGGSQLWGVGVLDIVLLLGPVKGTTGRNIQYVGRSADSERETIDASNGCCGQISNSHELGVIGGLGGAAAPRHEPEVGVAVYGDEDVRVSSDVLQVGTRSRRLRLGEGTRSAVRVGARAAAGSLAAPVGVPVTVGML